MDKEEAPVPEHIKQQAVVISRVDGVAFVYRLQGGRYVASSTDRHLMNGKQIECYVDGNRRDTFEL